MSLKAAMFAAAASYPPLQTALGTAPFNWFDDQLPPGATFPAVTVRQISRPGVYVATGQMPVDWTRFQVNCYGSGGQGQGADSESANDLVNAVRAFFLQWNSTGLPGTRPYNQNQVVGDRDFGIAPTQPLTYLRVLDVRVFANENALN